MHHNGPRGSTVAGRRNVVTPVLRIGAQSILTTASVTEISLTRTVTVSGMQRLLDARRQIRCDRNLTRTIHDLRDEQLGRAERSRNPEAFVSGSEVEPAVFAVWSNQRQLVRRRRAKPGPRS